MGKYKVVNSFLLLDDPEKPDKGKIQSAGDIIELSEERFEKAQSNLEKYGHVYLEKVSDEEQDESGQKPLTVSQIKKKLDELGIEYKATDKKPELEALLQGAETSK